MPLIPVDKAAVVDQKQTAGLVEMMREPPCEPEQCPEWVRSGRLEHVAARLLHPAQRTNAEAGVKVCVGPPWGRAVRLGAAVDNHIGAPYGVR